MTTDTAKTLARLWARTTVNPWSGCWEWTGTRSHGYGRINVGGRMRATHRIGYQLLAGDLDDTLVLHHRCRNRRCWRPDHLTQTTIRTNTLAGTGPTARHARATHCPAGHEYTAENTVRRRGRRHCRQCHRDRCRRDRARARQRTRLEFAG